MNKTHTTLISLLLGLAVVLGVAAAIKTTVLATPTSAADASSIAVRQQRLNRTEASLRRALARRRANRGRECGRTAPAEPRITYVRPAPVVVPSSSFDEQEHGEEAEDGDEDGFDD